MSPWGEPEAGARDDAIGGDVPGRHVLSNMPVLSSFWAAAARLGGRLDLSGCVAVGLDPARASDADLLHHGVSERHLVPLRRGVPVECSTLALPLTDARYPPLLRVLPHAPPVLFVSGDPSLLHEPGAAVVGARRCSPHARRFAGALAHAVAEAGGVVFSGLAWGIDTAAHEAAGARTVAVVGQGLEHPFGGDLARRVRHLVQAGGVLVSEYLPRTRPAPWTFRQRNRVISGLARATVVVEAGARSGSLITARCALDQGRDLFVVPDHPGSIHAAGGLALLETGVAPLLGPAALLEAIGVHPAARAAESSVLALLHDHPTAAVLAERTGESLRSWQRRLAALELAGRVERVPGGRFAPCVPRATRSPPG